jgi:hypothetical protein
LVRKNIRSAQYQDKLIAEADPRAFVSWLLALNSAREGKGINNPMSVLITRLSANPRSGAGGVYDNLAGLRPQRLARLILAALQDDSRSTGSLDWNSGMSETPRKSIHSIAVSLGIVTAV